MTRFRYWLADLISGGALSHAEWMAQQNRETALRRMQDEATARMAIVGILDATRHGKSGTAQKVARMAREALR